MCSRFRALLWLCYLRQTQLMDKAKRSNLWLKIVSKWVVVVSSGVQITEQCRIVPQSRVSSHFIEINPFFAICSPEIYIFTWRTEKGKKEGAKGAKETEISSPSSSYFLIYCSVILFVIDIESMLVMMMIMLLLVLLLLVHDTLVQYMINTLVYTINAIVGWYHFKCVCFY